MDVAELESNSPSFQAKGWLLGEKQQRLCELNVRDTQLTNAILQMLLAQAHQFSHFPPR